MTPRTAAQGGHGRVHRLLTAPTFRWIQAAMLVVLVIAFATSFESGSAGAGRLGYPQAFQAALPLVCDVVAGVATFIHGRVRADAPMRRLAGQFVLVPMLLSWGANAVDHVTRAPAGAGWTQAATIAWIAAVVLAAGICPVAVAALLHLSTRFVEFEQRQTAAPETRAAALTGVAAARPARPERSEAPRPSAPAEPEPQVAAEPAAPAEGASEELAPAEWAFREGAGWKRVQKQFPHLTEHHAKKVAAEAKARRELPPVRLVAGS